MDKGSILLSFVLTALALALLLAALTTDRWVIAEVDRANSSSSSGSVHFGLFWGSRSLNYGFGQRVYPLSITETQFREADFLVRELYFINVLTLGLGCVTALAAAVLALINSVARPKESACNLPGLIVVEVVTLALVLASIGCFVAQFLLKFRYNVLNREDRENRWRSENKAAFGLSFVALVIAALLLAVLVVILVGVQRSRRLRRKYSGKSNKFVYGNNNNDATDLGEVADIEAIKNVSNASLMLY